jgi:P-type E1-E2 ATPase
MGGYELQGQTALLIAVDGKATAIIALADIPKPEAASLIAALEKRNIRTYMCTGDNKRTAVFVARQIGIDNDRVIAEALPSDKFELVKRLQSQGELVAMIGIHPTHYTHTHTKCRGEHDFY